MRVLVVDDHPEVLDLVKRALDRDAHEVLLADCLTEAQQALSEHRPDIVVLDLGLPDGSGESLCRWLRARGPHPAILVLTAENARAHQGRAQFADSARGALLSIRFPAWTPEAQPGET